MYLTQFILDAQQNLQIQKEKQLIIWDKGDTKLKIPTSQPTLAKFGNNQSSSIGTHQTMSDIYSTLSDEVCRIITWVVQMHRQYRYCNKHDKELFMFEEKLFDQSKSFRCVQLTASHRHVIIIRKGSDLSSEIFTSYLRQRPQVSPMIQRWIRP